MKDEEKLRTEKSSPLITRPSGFILYPLSFILVFLLVACGENPTPTSVTQANITQASTSASITTAGASATNSPTNGVAVVSAPSATAVVAASPTIVPPSATLPVGSTSDRDQVLKAIRKLAQDTQSFRYTLQQQGELKSGNSATQFSATGTGEWQRPAFHQLLTLNLAGQTQKIEDYARDKELFERAVELVVWRKQGFTLTGPFPDLTRVEQAGNFKALGKEAISSQSTLKFSWEEPANRFLPAAGQPEGLGALSATNLYLAFTADSASTAQLSLWVDETSGAPLRYQLTVTLAAANSTLRYSATYDYTNLNDTTIKVDAPGDLLK